jgi:tetratricopeptide (TPR) repeat protein
VFLFRRNKAPKGNKRQLLQWAEDRMSHGVPRQDICDYLLSLGSDVMEIVHSRPRKADRMLAQDRAYSEAERELSGVMLARNLEAKELERNGKLSEAIELYEANLADRFSGSHPYARLRILYCKKKDYAAAIRVCYAAMANLKQGDKAEPFREWIGKLEQRVTPEQFEELRRLYRPRGPTWRWSP